MSIRYRHVGRLFALVAATCVAWAGCQTGPSRSGRRQTRSSRTKVKTTRKSKGFFGSLFGRKSRRTKRIDLTDLAPVWVFMLAEHMDESSPKLDMLIPVDHDGIVTIQSRYREYEGKRLFSFSAGQPLLLEAKGPARIVGLVLPDAPAAKAAKPPARRHIGVYEKGKLLKEYHVPIIPEAKEKTSYKGWAAIRAGVAHPVAFDIAAGTHQVEVSLMDKTDLAVRAIFVQPVHRD